VSDADKDALDARLRRLFAGVDTAPGFEARLAARIEALPGLPGDVLRVRIELQRETVRRRLRREAWLNAATAAGVGAALVALVWREGPVVTRWVEAGIAATSDPGAYLGVAFAALAFGLWIPLGKLARRL
jgi:hypothetical protein